MHMCPVIVLFVDIFLNCVLDAFNNLETKLVFEAFQSKLYIFQKLDSGCAVNHR